MIQALLNFEMCHSDANDFAKFGINPGPFKKGSFEIGRFRFKEFGFFLP